MFFHSSSYVRFTVAMLGVAGSSLVVSGQAYSPATDPLVQRTINMGEQMRAPTSGESNRELTVLDPRWSAFVLRLRVAPFPPLPPVLGDDVAPVVTAGETPSLPAAEFVGEMFYQGYATLLVSNRVPVDEARRIEAYRIARHEVVQQIQATFDQHAGSPAGERRAALAALWVGQEAALQNLAAEAESLRHDLAWVDSFYGSSGILGDPRRLDQASQEFFQLYSAAYNYAGLSTEQRRLLPELAHESILRGASNSTVEADRGAGYISFLPATARVILPHPLPTPLADKVRAFETEKARLKSELRRAVLAEDYFWVRSRTQRLQALAQTQAPQFAALEVMAEEIRVALAEMDFPAKSETKTLPADLTRRVGIFYARKVEVQREVLTRLRTLRTAEPGAQFDLVRQGDGLAVTQTAGSPGAGRGLAEFNASLARRYAEFAAESAVLRRDIQQYTAKEPGRVERTVDQLAADFAKAYASQENWNRYRDYRRAVLEPGLSPAQRQVLFQAAVVKLSANR